jgi:Ni2+-binding GTPase involved in maturation of urease and hydrogenase
MYKYSYALEKFSRAIYSLATGEADVRKRLLLVFQGDLLMITNKHLPKKVHKEYQWIIEQVTKYDEKSKGYNEYFKTPEGKYDHLLPGRIEATLHRMKNKTGVKISQKIFHIWSVLDEESRAL